MTRSRNSAPTQRQLRVGEEVRHILAKILLRGDYFDKRLFLSSSITVTEVRMSPDLKYAKVYIMPLGGENSELILKTLQKAMPTFRYEMGQKLTLKYTPSLQFRFDTTFDEAAKIESLLQSDHVKQDLS